MTPDKTPSDTELLALNAGEVHFSESPTKYPEAGHGTQYHAGAPGVLSFARAVLAKWGSPVVAGEPLTGGDERRHIICLCPDCATPQPTQAQADTPCRKNPFYHGPRNCSRGTVGCCEDHGANNPQAQAGVVQTNGD